jgi:hypothetical protein
MDHLYILWTNADEIVFDKMVAMYARNSLLKHWWGEVTIIVWGATAKMATMSDIVKQRITELQQVGVKLSACKACADSLGVTESLERMGIEVKYWGEGLTKIIKDDEKLISV